MLLSSSLRNMALWLGVGFSLLWTTVLSSVPTVQRLELKVQDCLMAIAPPPALPPELLLIKIHKQDLSQPELLEDPIFYANVVDRLFQGGAATVILNLRPNWLPTADHPNNPIKVLVNRYPDRLVLVLPTTSASFPSPAKWQPYNYFIPLDSHGHPVFPVNSIMGFSEYEPGEHHHFNINSPDRRVNLVGRFIFSDSINKIEYLDAAVWLGLKKFQRQQDHLKLSIDFHDTDPIQVHFWPKDTPFPSLDLRIFQADTASPKVVHNKIIIVGFADLEDPNSFPIHSPFGELLSNVDFQATILGNLLTHSFYRAAPLWLSGVIAIGGGVLISQGIVGMMLRSRTKQRDSLGLNLIIVLSLCSLSLIGWWQRFVFPVALLLLTWGGTACSIVICILFGIRENLIELQQGEIARLRSVEQEAVITQARKLLDRIAANIHDGPLQELKLIMDSLEILKIDHVELDIESILDRLENLGHHLRQQLHQTRTLSLQITPELREGLASGISKKIEELVTTEQLTLNVKTKLEHLTEPYLNSDWLSAREGILCFFSEAIANVIQHAQPPNGTSTQIIVTLKQMGSSCSLSIENDGAYLDASILATPYYSQHKHGGYGTKLMENIASELPEGLMERKPLKHGGMRVALFWDISAYFNSVNKDKNLASL